jgi:hypothetical protein
MAVITFEAAPYMGNWNGTLILALPVHVTKPNPQIVAGKKYTFTINDKPIEEKA